MSHHTSSLSVDFQPFLSFYLPSPSGLVRGHDCLNETTALPPPSKGTVRSNRLHWRQTFGQLEKTCKLQTLMNKIEQQNFCFMCRRQHFFFFFNCLLVINFQLFFLPEGVSFVLKLVVLWSVAFLLLQKLKKKKKKCFAWVSQCGTGRAIFCRPAAWRCFR